MSKTEQQYDTPELQDIAESLHVHMEAFNIPHHMRGGFERYVMNGISPGSFGYAVLTNDLTGAFGKADLTNQAAMLNYARFLINGLPAICWKTDEKVQDWMKSGGFVGRYRDQTKGEAA